MITCDLNKDYFLVPKLWAKEIVLGRLSQFTSDLMKELIALPLLRKDNQFELIKNAEITSRILSGKKFVLRDCFERQRR